MQAFKYISILTCSLLLGFQAVAQKKSKVEFRTLEQDMGKIKEVDGAKMVEFKFQNSGKYPIYLKNVAAACGCTLPSWPKDTIPPGQQASIWARFDPSGRNGEFDKKITVVCGNCETEFYTLTLKGEVIPRDMIPAEKYPFKKGNLRFRVDHMTFGDINTNEVDTLYALVYNDGFSSITVQNFSTPEYLTCSMKDMVIKPKQEAMVMMVIDGRKCNDYGFIFNSFALVTDDREEPNKGLYYSVNVHEYFAKLSKEDSLKAPRVKFDKMEHNWGTMKQGEIMHTEFIITNTGKSDLLIRKTKASCGCTASEPEKMVLKKGESTKIRVSFNSAGRQGHQSKAIDVITNDPYNPVVKLGIAGEVQVPAPEPQK